MEYRYKLTGHNSVIRISDGACIPFAEGNSDYQRYLKDVEEGAKVVPASPGEFHEWDEVKNEWVFQKDIAVLKFTHDIDAHADKIYELFAMSPGRSQEYQIAEEQAKAFKAAGYIGEAGSFIVSWATPTGMTLKAATDDILRAAAQFRFTIETVRSTRLAGKEEVRSKRALNTMQEVVARTKGELDAIPMALSAAVIPS